MKLGRSPEYVCSKCGREVGRDNLMVRRISFRRMGESGRVLKTKVTDWLCTIKQEDGTSSCLELDEYWNTGDKE